MPRQHRLFRDRMAMHWTTMEGITLPVACMDDKHLKNTLLYLANRTEPCYCQFESDCTCEHKSIPVPAVYYIMFREVDRRKMAGTWQVL